MFAVVTSLLSLGMTVGPPKPPKTSTPADATGAAKSDSFINKVVPTNLIEGSEAPEDFVSQVPKAGPFDLPAWAQEGPTFRRAGFWENGQATMMEIVNVLGRFESASEWGERDFFLEVDPKIARKEVEDNSWTLKRYQMAQRMGMVERVALAYNIGNLNFTNAKLAAAVGKTVEDFESLPVSTVAADIVFDALVESKSGLLNPDELNKRRNLIIGTDGTFNELNFRLGLYKARALVVLSWFLLGKGNFVWILVGCQLLHDARPDLFPTPKDLELFKIFAIV